MVEQTRPVGVGERYREYIEELREFFTSRQVRFGTPADLIVFARLVAAPGPFPEEMESMVRSFLYREGEHLGHGELLELVVFAAGGPEGRSAPETQGAVRQVLAFLHAALRQAHTSFSDETAAEEGAAPEVLPSAPVLAETVRPAPEPVRLSAPRAETPSRPAAGNEVLYRAMSLAAEETAAEPLLRQAPSAAARPAERAPRGPWWAIPAIGLALAAMGAGMYIGRPLVERRHAQSLAGSSGNPMYAGSGTSSCVAPAASGVTRSGLEERSLWAHSLLEQKLYEAALPELREIARLDPGYPGIKLDESDALLNLKRPSDAREAIDAQISVSECLAKLPSPALDEYCHSQFSNAAVGGCRTQLTHIRQAAELQAALVHLELGHQVQPDAEAAAALAELTKDSATPPKARRPREGARPRRVEPLPPAREGDAATPPLPR